MAFGIDDAAIIALESAESAEAVEGATEELASEEFGAQSFGSDNFGKFHDSNLSDSEISEMKSTDSELSDIEREFSPEKFNVNPVEDPSQNASYSLEQIERTSTFEEQTIDNFELESMRPGIEDNMSLGQEHDGGVLRYNMEQAMDVSSDTEISNAHHIVGRDTPQAAKKLEEFGIDRNDPANGIFLPNSSESPLKGAVHGQGRHSLDYSNEVEQRFAGVTSREEALEVLQSIKEDLYTGELYVHKDIPPNK